MADAIIQEVRRIKEANAAAHGYDVHSLLEATRQRERTGRRRVVTLTPRRPVGRTAGGEIRKAGEDPAG